jgi:uncharacterized membrane protein
MSFQEEGDLLKKYFITGLIILLPVTLTFVIVAFIFNLLTDPFLGLSKAIVGDYYIGKGVFFLSNAQLENLISKVMILCVLFAFTLLLGLFGRWLFIHYLIRFWEFLIHRIPIVNVIYKGCQDVIKTIFTSDTSAFKQVVLVRFPNPETYTIGLVTCDTLPSLHALTGEQLVAVFVPTTPNPTSGFMSLFRKAEIIPLDMKIEEAFKYVISCGVIITPFKRDNVKNQPCAPMEGKNEKRTGGK